MSANQDLADRLDRRVLRALLALRVIEARWECVDSRDFLAWPVPWVTQDRRVTVATSASLASRDS